MNIFQFISLLVCLSTLPLFVENISQKEVNEIKSGLQFAQKLTSHLNSSSFIGFLNTASKSAIKFVSTTVSFVGFVLSFLGTNESLELLEIKRLYNEMNRRFDLLDYEIIELKKEIKWSQVKLQYSSIERTIMANSKLLKAIYDSPLLIKESEKDYFIHSFESAGMKSASNLYEGLIGEKFTLNDDLLHVAMVSFEYSRPKMQTLMMGLLKLFAESITTELAYRRYKYGEAQYIYYKTKWAACYKNVSEHMIDIDKEVRKHYYAQAEKDIARISQNNTGIKNRNISEIIYNFLVQKYDWRDWLVIAYKPIWGVKNHYNYLCGGYRRYGMYGRDLVVASVDKSKQPLNITEAGLIINGVNTKPLTTPCNGACAEYRDVYNGHSACVRYKPSFCPTTLNAQQVFHTIPTFKMDCSVYASVGVIDSWVDLSYQGRPERLVHKRTPGSNSYSIHIFG